MSGDGTDLRVRDALAGIRRGWAYTPLVGKKPRLTDWTGLPRASADEVAAWARTGNVGVRTGTVSGVVVVDVDSAKGGAAPDALAGIVTPTVETGGGGLHLYFRCPDGGLPNSVSRLAPHVDVRGDGGQVVAVGSVHPDTGRVYLWRAGRSPDDAPLAELPADVVRALRAEKAKPTREPVAVAAPPGSAEAHGTPYGVEALRRECAEVATAPEGTRNDRLNAAAFNLGQLLASRDIPAEAEVVRALTDAATRAGLEASEIAATIASGIAAGRASPRAPRKGPELPTDLGNARRFVRREGDRFRYAAERGWLAWDGRRWAEDATDEVKRAAKTTAESIFDEAKAATSRGDTEGAERLGKWAIRSQDAHRLAMMARVAESELPVRVAAGDFDADPFLLNVENGTLDLRDGTLHAHRRSDLITRLAPVAFDPAATAPRWRAFLADVVPDPETRAFLRRFVGYCLTGDTREQAFLVLHGKGGNGKSTFIETIAALVGDYHAATPIETFMATRSVEAGAASPHLAALAGARLVVAVEPPEGARLNEALLKQATGGDEVVARQLYRAPFTFTPRFKIALIVNHQPRISETTDAIWRRVLLVPFDVRIPDDRRDLTLGATLRAELPGILNWALEGLAEWRLLGLRPPAVVRAATSKYRSAEDDLREFVETCCVVGPDHHVSARDLYGAFRRWCEENGERPVSQTRLGVRLGERAGLVRRKVHGTYRWFGIALRTTGAPRADDDAGDGGDGLRSVTGLSFMRAHEGSSPEEPSTVPTVPPMPGREPGEEG